MTKRKPYATFKISYALKWVVTR